MQMAALIAKTLLGEKRRTWHGIIISGIIRPINIEAIEDKRKNEADLKKREKLKRVEGFDRNYFYGKGFEQFFDEVKIAEVELGQEKCDLIRASIATHKRQQS